MTIKNMIRIIALSMGLLSAVTVTGFAQTPAPSAPIRLDARWTPYLGCWRLFQENVREPDVPVSDVMIVCVAPSGTDKDNGVTMTTIVAGRTILEQKIVADGGGHPVTEPDCQGTQTSDWSRDGARLFTTATVQCSGRPMRAVSGITLMTRGPSWVDIQATDVDGASQVRVRRYQRTDMLPAGVAQLPTELTTRTIAEAEAASAVTLNLEDVLEASKRVSAAALEAALDETGARFALNSRTLRQLADAGVSPNVIDLMVAQSFPRQFKVERAPSPAPPTPTSASVGGTTVIYNGVPASMPYPYYDPYYSYYAYYSPFAYPYWSSGYYYNNYYYSNRYYTNRYYSNRGPGTTVIIQNDGDGRAVASPQPSQPPRVVNGRGYTRVSPGSATSASDAATTAPHATTTPQGARRARSSDSSSSTSSSSSDSPSSSSSSSGGSDSGSGQSSGGRTAQPR